MLNASIQSTCNCNRLQQLLKPLIKQAAYPGVHTAVLIYYCVATPKVFIVKVCFSCFSEPFLVAGIDLEPELKSFMFGIPTYCLGIVICHPDLCNVMVVSQ